MTTKVAVIGSGNIGTDLMFKLLRRPGSLELAAVVGIDPASDGLRRAERLGVPTTAEGVEGLLRMPGYADIAIVMDATSAAAHRANAAAIEAHARRTGRTPPCLIDLTPAALGPYVVPCVNLSEHLEAPRLNMVTCGGQATIPVVAAVSAVAEVLYAEIVASVSSRSAGPGTRANIDEFTETTGRAIEEIGGAARGKAIILLNPAEPPLIMRDTVYCVTGEADLGRVRDAIATMVARVAEFVPGYRLKQEVQFAPIGPGTLRPLLGEAAEAARHRVTVFLEVEGAGDYLPAYAGNLDIMTAAAVRVAEGVARQAATPAAEED